MNPEDYAYKVSDTRPCTKERSAVVEKLIDDIIKKYGPQVPEHVNTIKKNLINSNDLREMKWNFETLIPLSFTSDYLTL
jgi:hypothetical protein